MSPSSVLKRLDLKLAKMLLSIRQESPSLLTFLFHSLFEDENEIQKNLIDPQQYTTVADLDFLISFFQSLGYRFVTPDEIRKGLDPSGRFALLTFDDGYANNLARHYPFCKSTRCPLFFSSARAM